VAAGYALVYQPIAQKNAAAATLDAEIQKKQEEYDKIKAERQRLIDIKKRSLPPDQAIARREYAEMMSRLLSQAKVTGFHVRELTTAAPPRTALHQGHLRDHVREGRHVGHPRFPLGYYRLDLLHQITLFELRSDAQPTAATAARR